jgi:hypothetical protein
MINPHFAGLHTFSLTSRTSSRTAGWQAETLQERPPSPEQQLESNSELQISLKCTIYCWARLCAPVERQLPTEAVSGSKYHARLALSSKSPSWKAIFVPFGG